MKLSIVEALKEANTLDQEEYIDFGSNILVEDYESCEEEVVSEEVKKEPIASSESERVLWYNKALALAKYENKPVIYGYERNGNYYKIDEIVCDNLEVETHKVMSRFHPSGSVLVAYPDKEFKEVHKQEEPKGIDISSIAPTKSKEDRLIEDVTSQDEEAKKIEIETYRKFAGLSPDDVVTEDNIEQWAFDKTCVECNCSADRLRNELLGK